VAAERPFKLLVVSHAADLTGAPISALSLARTWAATDGVEIQVLLRRGGPLQAEFEAVAPTEVFRKNPNRFTGSDALVTALRGKPILALKGLRNPNRPYVENGLDKAHLPRIKSQIRHFAPDAIYVSTTHCGDALEPLELSAPIFTHVREMADVLAGLDTRRRKFALDQSAHLWGVSAPVAGTLIETYGLDAGRVSVEPPAMDLDDIDRKIAADWPTNVSAAPGTPCIVGAGSVIHRKGPDLFLDMAEAALAIRSDLQFIWLGDGDMRSGLIAETERRSLASKVSWPGQIANPYPILKATSVCALTSREDPHPRVMMEAAALGVPVTAFAGSGGADAFIPHYAAGQLSRMGDTGRMAASVADLIGQTTNAAPVRAALDVRASAARLLDRMKPRTSPDRT